VGDVRTYRLAKPVLFRLARKLVVEVGVFDIIVLLPVVTTVVAEPRDCLHSQQ
jgi:hypothetical protein